jgi:hypothetical protein
MVKIKLIKPQLRPQNLVKIKLIRPQLRNINEDGKSH